MLFDSHSHTKFSADSEMQAKDALQAAARAGVGLVFTEHLDLDFPGEDVFEFSPQKYWQEYLPLRGDQLRLGVEIGLEQGTLARSRAFVAEVPFDLVIGSIHLLEHHDLYYPDYYRGRSKEEVFHAYFQTMAEQIRACDFCDVLGHIDYIVRYAPYEEHTLDYKQFHEEIDAVLRAVIEQGKVMELNTRRLGDKAACEDLLPVYQRYHALGGRYVTLGSDAHTPEAIGVNFAAGQQLAAAAGLQLVTFKARKMELCQ